MAKASKVVKAAEAAETEPVAAGTETEAPAAAPKPVASRRKPAVVEPADEDPSEGKAPSEGEAPGAIPAGKSDDQIIAEMKPGQQATLEQCNAIARRNKRLIAAMPEAEQPLTNQEMRQILRGRRPLRRPQ